MIILRSSIQVHTNVLWVAAIPQLTLQDVLRSLHNNLRREGLEGVEGVEGLTLGLRRKQEVTRINVIPDAKPASKGNQQMIGRFVS